MEKEQWLDGEGNGTRAENRERRRHAGKAHRGQITSKKDSGFVEHWGQELVGKEVILKRDIRTQQGNTFPEGQVMKIREIQAGKFILKVRPADYKSGMPSLLRGVKRKWFEPVPSVELPPHPDQEKIDAN